MAIYYGNQKIGSVYHGSSAIKEAYRGDTRVLQGAKYGYNLLGAVEDGNPLSVAYLFKLWKNTSPIMIPSTDVITQIQGGFGLSTSMVKVSNHDSAFYYYGNITVAGFTLYTYRTMSTNGVYQEIVVFGETTVGEAVFYTPRVKIGDSITPNSISAENVSFKTNGSTVTYLRDASLDTII